MPWNKRADRDLAVEVIQDLMEPMDTGVEFRSAREGNLLLPACAMGHIYCGLVGRPMAPKEPHLAEIGGDLGLTSKEIRLIVNANDDSLPAERNDQVVSTLKNISVKGEPDAL